MSGRGGHGLGQVSQKNKMSKGCEDGKPEKKASVHIADLDMTSQYAGIFIPLYDQMTGLNTTKPCGHIRSPDLQPG